MRQLKILLVALLLAGCYSAEIPTVGTIDDVSGVYNISREKIVYRCGDSVSLIDSELIVQVTVSEYEEPNTIEMIYSQASSHDQIRYIGWREGNQARLFRRLVTPYHELLVEIELNITFVIDGFSGVDTRRAVYVGNNCAGVGLINAKHVL